MILTPTSNAWPSLCITGVLAILGWYSWRRRNVPGARPFAVACVTTVLALVAAVAEAVAVDVSAKMAWRAFQTVWQLPSATAVTCFVLEYVQPGRWLTRRNLLLLSIAPLLNLVLVLSNNLHHWLWLGFAFEGALLPVRGVGVWAMLGYSFALLLINLVAFAWLYVRSPRHRWPIALMVLGQLAGRASYTLDLARGKPAQAGPFVVTVMAVFGVYAVALFGFRIFEPLAAARAAVVQQMRDGMVVFDADWRALSLNPAAERILGVRAVQARGKAWADLLPSCPGGAGCLGSPAGATDVTLGPSYGQRRYALDLSRLQDGRGVTVGYLLLLRDVTEERRAQARLVEQRWAQAALQEREQLAHELHDGLSQGLGYLNVQAQAAGLYLRSGDGEAVQASLTRLAEASRELQSDTRELIANLLTIDLPTEGMCSALRQEVDRFEKRNGLQVQLEIDDAAGAACDSAVFSPAAGVQLLRIVQEALANVRKHAGRPGRVLVRLSAEGGQVRLAVADDGAGFDPSLPAGGEHFGLQVMARRAARLGGQMTVHSAPGEGTRVEARVPLAAGEGGAEE